MSVLDLRWSGVHARLPTHSVIFEEWIVQAQPPEGGTAVRYVLAIRVTEPRMRSSVRSSRQPRSRRRVSAGSDGWTTAW